MKGLVASLFVPFAMFGQLTLTTGSCATGKPISSDSVFDLGQVAAGATTTVTFLGCNPGNTAVNVTTILVAGTGFTLSGAPTTYLDPPLNALPLRFSVQFSATTPASYSASLQVNSISVFLVAKVIPAPALSVDAPCSFSGNQINFGGVSFGKSDACNFSLQAVSSIAVTGIGFQLMSVPGGTSQFTIQLAPVCGTTFYSGTLTIGIQAYVLTGTGFLPPLPTPILNFDAPAIGSGQQHTVTMSLPSVYPCPGQVPAVTIHMAFAPAAGLSNDPTVSFLSMEPQTPGLTLGSDGVHFSPNAVFNTGSTAGAITFSVSANGLEIAGDPVTTIPLPATPVSVDTVTASNQVLGQLDITITGFDNTYSAGQMTFTFFDAAGNTISGTPVNADFTSNFKTFFSAQAAGSTFLARVSFPVTGPQTQVASVAVTLTNTAGQAQTGKLTFQ